MLAEIYRFELRHHLRSPVLWLGAAVFFLLSFGAVTTDAVQIGGSLGAVNRNAPYVIVQFLLIWSILGAFVTTAFVAGSVLRDAQYRTEDILYSTPMGKGAYLLGRFGGSLTAALLVYLFVALAIVVGSAMPWLDPERVGPFMLSPYLYGLVFFVIPNVLLMSAVFFGLATLTRSMMGTYLGLLAFFVAYAIAGTLLADIENESLAVLLDPFGGAAFEVATKYWTTVERNTLVPAVSGGLLTNRLVVLGVAALALFLTWARFSFTVSASRKGKARVVEEPTPEPVPGGGEAPGAGAASRRPEPTAAGSALRQLLHQARFETLGVIRSVPFIIILAFGVLNVIGNSTTMESLAGTPVWPVTHLVLTVIQSASLFFFLILVFYSGELVWRERQERIDLVQDALPVPSWVLWGGKLAALLAVLGLLLIVSMLTGMGVQAYHGYTRFQPGLYLESLFLEIGPWLALVAILGIFLQVALNQKYLGFLALAAYFVAIPAAGALDLDHHLVLYGTTPGTPYSDLNGYGGFLGAAGWFDLYWGFGAVALLALVHLLWVRGQETGLRQRLSLARQRLGPGVYRVLAVAAVGFLGTGAWIYYNTNVLNDYVPDDVGRDRRARYEREYERFEWAPQPRIRSADARVDIYPGRRDVDIRGTYRLVNPHDVPVDSVHVLLDPDVTVRELVLPGARRVRHDEELGWDTWKLDRPLAPGAELEMTFDLSVVTRGFTNEPAELDLAHDGTFFNNFDYFPHIGYDRGLELTDPNERRKRGLPEVERMPSLDDPRGRTRNYLTGESDWVDFQTVVSTSADQVALAPGYLEDEWEEDGRRYFRYRMDAPILGFWSYLSARWEVTRDRWHDVDIAVYHHPDHDYNVARMIEAVKKSLDYYTREFGPYQHHQVRIVEFPGYASFAQSFPNTIPFSESIGFIARLEDPDDIDYVFYVTAHEVAHQWWAHQVIGGFQQGATVLSETLAQYSALMVMEKEYGPEKMRRFLKYELDAYLRGRGSELLEELPLMRVENQGYIHYRKGSLVMYALRDYVGEEALNSALRGFLDEWKFQGPPYPTSRDLLRHIAQVVPPEQKGLLDDLFRRIILYELRAREATAEPTGDGRWRVRLSVDAAKFQADGKGDSREVPLDALIDVGVFGAEEEGSPPEGRVLYLEKRRITSADSVVEVVVEGEPRRAGIDPFNKLIDRNPENNLVEVDTGG